jgi:VWFA-related protein
MKQISIIRVVIALSFIFHLTFFVAAQSGRNKQTQIDQKKVQNPSEQTTEESKQNNKQQPIVELSDDDIVKVDTNLVLVPLIVSDRNNNYTRDLKREEVEIYEDNIKQEIVFFGTTSQPFHVVLMLDTSGSTQEKLPLIQQAAFAFVTQLQNEDKVKIISFDDQVRTLSDFTNDRNELRNAIYRTRPGRGTKLYDAMETAIASLQKIQGRKAIVIFTDGVDWTSDYSSSKKNLEKLEEAGIIVYPIRYDTREEVERLVRQQQQGGQVVDLNVIFGTGIPNGGSTPTTFPGGTSIPTKSPPSTGPFPPVVINRPTTTTTRQPPNTGPTTGGPRDSIEAELDAAYARADAYLRDLANISGGTLHRADSLVDLPTAFARIADELRTQYSIGYYSTNKTKDGKFRKLKVKTTRKNVVVRAKPGYRVPKEG